LHTELTICHLFNKQMQAIATMRSVLRCMSMRAVITATGTV
jgi:hypothetical protein